MSGLIPNRVAVLCDVNTVTTDTDDSTLLQISTDGKIPVDILYPSVIFYKSPDENTTPYTNVAGNIGEYWYARCGFMVQENCIIQNINLNFKVIVYDSVGDVEGEFSLETWNNPTSSFYNGLFTDISIKQEQPFFIVNNSPFSVKSINRYPILDDVGYYAYEINYGFQLGYSWWQQLDEFAKQFETYRSQYWAVYTQNEVVQGDPIQVDGGSAAIKLVFTWDILDTTTDIVTQFNHTCNISANDEAYTASITGVITTQDATYGDDLDQNVADDVQTEVIGTFTGTNIGVAPSGKSVIGEMAIYFEDGSINRYDRTINGVDVLSDSLWIAEPVVTIVDANTITVSGTLNIERTLVERLYVRFGYGQSGLLTDAGIQISTDGGEDIYVD